eukprot:GDKK01019929.1.p1 GENE.GDKK01019929.1~~GDKK01019929.1.p1  ORF type:complete len:182 (+),score=38.53 GDKK01019929.1:37-582(+)
MFVRTFRSNFPLASGLRRFSSEVPKVKAAPVESATEVVVKKSSVKQSPIRMKFLAMLIRDTWVPDALAQLKFSPKHKAVDIAAMVKRGIAIAKLNYDAIPEELKVKEIIVTKGSSYKKLRIMGRGRTGIGKIRSTHVTIKLDKVDFTECIEKAYTAKQRSLWTGRKNIVDKLRNTAPPAPK